MSYPPLDGFPASYRQSREHLLDGARALASRHGLLLDSRSIPPRGPEGETLAIDCCVFGSRSPRHAVVVSSGLHGVEGFAGAAIQHRMLSALLPGLRLARDTAVIVLHALNPYGFAWLRRVTEDNVDLNRNFRAEFDRLASEGYVELCDELNPPDLDPARERIRWQAIEAWIAGHGMRRFQQVVSEGQYRYPAGVQFGGFGRTPAAAHVEALVDDYLRGTEQLVWIDFHTGLGPSGSCQLLSAAREGSARLGQVRSIFGEAVVAVDGDESVSPPVHGMLEAAVADSLGAHCRLAFVSPEFGTHALDRVLRAVRADNWLHAHGRPDDLGDPMTRAVKAELIEAFRPDDARWRRQVLETGEALVRRACSALPGVSKR